MVSIETLDLAELAGKLRERFLHTPPVGYLAGKTAMRDAVEQELGCSDLEAEEIVDTLELQRFVEFDGSPAEPVEEVATWRIGEGSLSGQARGRR